MKTFIPLFIFPAQIMFITIFFLPVLLLIAYFIKTKNQEKMNMIEKGINPEENISISEYRKQTSLKNGILFISFGLGLLVANILDNIIVGLQEMDSFLIYVTMFLIFGGIGFLINYSIIKKSGKN